VTGAITLGGWLAAGLAAAVALAIWRMLRARLEAVATACHELRGPLTAARLGLALGDRVGELTPARLRAVELELARASLAVDDLAGGRGWRESNGEDGVVDLGQLLADSVEAWRAAGARAGVGLVAHWSGPPARLVADRARLAQAVGNLIANAIEHGGGEVEVRGHVEGAAARIEVRDRGPGLTAPLAGLGRRAPPRRGCLTRSRSWRDRGQRRGRGLAIAAAIAAGHGGRLAVAPSECGARLVLELPLAPRSI
jgi:signal transduction histidine kinase